MGELKSELSPKNQYWIPRHRYYELKHYCLQYPHWKELYRKLEFKMGADFSKEVKEKFNGRPAEKLACIRADCKKAMELVERCCKDAFPELSKELLFAVTEGVSYDILQAQKQIPCSRDMYYDRYRKFFYILSQRRGI